MKRLANAIVKDVRGEGRGLYLVLTGAIVVYIAMCAWEWDNRWLVDAWEHHRAVKAIAMQPWEPGNPTVRSDEPSIRYSPLTVALGLISRWGGVSPTDVYSGSAIVCAIILFWGLWKWLAVMGMSRCAWIVLAMALCVWGGNWEERWGSIWGIGGGAPKWANSLALADLPGNMAYPSAWVFAAALWGWWILEKLNGQSTQHSPDQRKAKQPNSQTLTDSRLVKSLMWGGLVLLTTFAILTHIMTAVVMVIGLTAGAIVPQMSVRQAATSGVARTAIARRVIQFGAVLALAVGLSLLWPWYSLWEALTTAAHPDWYSAEIHGATMLAATVPALIGAAISWWCIRDLRVAKWCLLCGAVCWVMGVSAWWTHSPTAARVPIAGVFFWQVMMGVMVGRAIGDWRDGRKAESQTTKQPNREDRSSQRLEDRGQKSEAGGRLGGMRKAILVVCVGLALWGVVPQFKDIAYRAYLARPWLAPLLGREDQQMDLRDRFARLIGREAEWGGIGIYDVVLSDPDTSWAIPSIRGRIVSPARLEYFLKDQPERLADVRRFFSEDASGPERKAILEKYEVKWLIVHKQRVSEALWNQLVRESAIVARSEDMVVMRVEE